MSQLALIKQKIKSIKTTKKITNAMRFISMTLYAKLDKKREAVDLYKSQIDQMFFNLMSGFDNPEDLIPLNKHSFDPKPLLIIISSIKGFCGNLNTALFKFLLKNNHFEEHQSTNIIVVGRQTEIFIKKEKLGQIVEKYNSTNSKNFPAIASDMTQKIWSNIRFYSSISIFYSEIKNLFIQIPKKIKVFSVKDFQSQETPKTSTVNLNPIWEQDKDELMDEIIKTYLKGLLMHALFQSLISESAARFLSMDNASNNAESYLSKLENQLNKLRQGAITQEICELSANL